MILLIEKARKVGCSNCENITDFVIGIAHDSKGRIRYPVMCTHCLEPQGSIRAKAIDALKLNPQQSIKHERKHIDYELYLLSPEWKIKKEKRLLIDGNKCQSCSSEDNLQVHHLTYRRLGFENINDLITLCSLCHKKEHELMDNQARFYSLLIDWARKNNALSIVDYDKNAIEIIKCNLSDNSEFEYKMTCRVATKYIESCYPEQEEDMVIKALEELEELRFLSERQPSKSG